MYEIYPGKACVDEDATQCNSCLRNRIELLGRYVGSGPGGRCTSTASHNTPPSSREQRGIIEKKDSSLLVVLQ
jgi:hypothetical protein